MTRRILITGATGFVGRQVLRALLEGDTRLICVTRNESSKEIPNSPQIEKKVLTKNLFSEEEAWWREVLQGVDTIVHLAWYVEPATYQTSNKNLDCLIGTLQIARAALRAGVRRFVGVGTCLEYKSSTRPLSTTDPLLPLSPYAACKAAIYLALCEMLPRDGIEFAWCRLFYLHGEGENPRRLVPTLRSRLSKGQIVDLTEGSQVRDFMDVRQAGRQIADIAVSDKCGAFNICSGQPVVLRQFVESIADEYAGRNLLHFGAREDRPNDPPYMVGVNSL